MQKIQRGFLLKDEIYIEDKIATRFCSVDQSGIQFVFKFVMFGTLSIAAFQIPAPCKWNVKLAGPCVSRTDNLKMSNSGVSPP